MSDVIEAEPGTALALLPRASLPTIIAADSKDILGKLARELAGYEPDASTPAGRTRINAVKKTIGTAKMDFVRLADTLMEDAKKTIDGVKGERKIIEDRMDAMRDQIGRPLAEYNTREKTRTDAHEAMLAGIEGYLPVPLDMPSSRISEAIAAVDELLPDGLYDWEEFKDRAARTCARVAAGLIAADVDARTRETEAAELARLHAEAAERDRRAAIEAQRVREEQIARDAAEAARLTAEAEAERKAREAQELARTQLQAAEALRAHQAQEAERKAADAAEALARAGRERLAGIEREKAAAERAEAERVSQHRTFVSILAKSDHFWEPEPTTAQIRQAINAVAMMMIPHGGGNEQPCARDYEEFQAEAEAAHEGALTRLKEMLTIAEAREAAKAEADRIERYRVIAERERLAEENAEKQRVAAFVKAERDAQAAVEAERERVARDVAAQKAADEARAADIAHRTTINREVIADLMAVRSDVTDDLAKVLLVAIVKGNVRNCGVKY